MATVDRSAGVIFASDTLDDGQSTDITLEGSDVDAAEVHNIIHGGSCTVTVLVDSDNTGSFDKTVDVDTFSGSGISQGNSLELAGDDVALRITDSSGGTGNDYVITGVPL